MENGQHNRSTHDKGKAASFQLRRALQELKSASRLISVVINEELAGSKEQGVLDGLYRVKGSVIRAIEETEKRISIDDDGAELGGFFSN